MGGLSESCVTRLEHPSLAYPLKPVFARHATPSQVTHPLQLEVNNKKWCQNGENSGLFVAFTFPFKETFDIFETNFAD